MELIRQAFRDDVLLLDLDAHSMGDVFEAAATKLIQLDLLNAGNAEEVVQGLREREAQASTAIGHAVAVPHVYLDAVEQPVVLMARLRHGVNMGAPDGIPTKFVFFLLGPPTAASRHLDTLATIARMMADDEFRYEAASARSGTQLSEALDHFITRTTPVERPQVVDDEIPEGLRYTGRPFGGVVQDMARRYRHYLGDLRDGLHPKCFASVLFLFFACTAPTVIFGGIMAAKTGYQIGVVEMIIATSIGGCLYALFSGQPLVILGGTGPLLVFIAILYQGCEQMELDFLPVYAWVGLWTGGFVILLAAFDASCLMRFFTRFTDESFSALISLIFIYEAISSLIAAFTDLEGSQQHATALLTLLLALGTFYLAMTLSQFRRSSYLRPYLREFLADFGPTIALAAMTWVSFILKDVELEKLSAPDTFGPTAEGRSWLIDIAAAPLWIKLGAAIPAIFGAVLVYLDQNITARLVNSRDHRLQRGPGYHVDLAIVGGLVATLSVFGLPWLVAATVRSLNHVRSLASREEVVTPSGDSHERILHVRENRLTGLSIHLLMAGSLLLLPYLQYVPMAVLYGLFLFMGVVSIAGNQFFERISLWLKEPDLYPTTHYIRRAPARVIHGFTGIQLACLTLLWMVKEHQNPTIKLLFPLFIALLVPVRWAMGHWFKQEHLAALDAEEEPEDEETHWAG